MRLVRDIVRPSMVVPCPNRADTFVMELWAEMRSQLAAGSQLELLRWRCDDAGLSRAGAMEVWERCKMVDAEVEAFHALLRSANG